LELDYLVYSLYIIPLIICIRSFQISSENYDRLPDKIPMHFGITGQADKWWKKSRFSVYLMPAIGIFTVVMMCGVLASIYHESGPLPDDFNFSLLLFTFSLSYLFYRTQTGIIRYALGEIHNIWPDIKIGLLFLVLSSVLMSVLPFIPAKPTILNAVMCTEVENGTPINAKSTFSLNDRNATLFLKLGNVRGKHLIRMEWINPEGKEHFVHERHTHHKRFAKYLPWWSYIYIKDNRANILPGNWHVAVFIDREPILTQRFSISQDDRTD